MDGVINLLLLRNARNYLTSLKSVSFSRRNLLHGVRKSLSYFTVSSLKCLRFRLCQRALSIESRLDEIFCALQRDPRAHTSSCTIATETLFRE